MYRAHQQPLAATAQATVPFKSQAFVVLVAILILAASGAPAGSTEIPFSTSQAISAGYASLMFLADIDGDGDLDVVGDTGSEPCVPVVTAEFAQLRALSDVIADHPDTELSPRGPTKLVIFAPEVLDMQGVPRLAWQVDVASHRVIQPSDSSLTPAKRQCCFGTRWPTAHCIVRSTMHRTAPPSRHATTPPIDLGTAEGSVHLSFDRYISSHSSQHGTVEISTDGGTSWMTLIQTMDEDFMPYTTWQCTQLDVSDHAEETVELRFAFDTVTADYLDRQGFSVDNVVVEAEVYDGVGATVPCDPVDTIVYHADFENDDEGYTLTGLWHRNVVGTLSIRITIRIRIER